MPLVGKFRSAPGWSVRLRQLLGRRAEALSRAEAALTAKARLQKRLAIGTAGIIIITVAAGWWAYGVISERHAVAIEAKREDIRGQIVSYATSPGGVAMDIAEGYKTSPYSTAVSKELFYHV
jgi:hypothetical protein